VKKELAKSADEALTSGLADFVGNINVAMETVSKQLLKVAPDAAQLLLKAIQLEAWVTIAQGALLLSASGFLILKVSKPLVKKANEMSGGEEPYIAAFVVSTFAAIFLAISGAVTILGTRMWIAAFSPEASIALKALDAVTK
jgi:hypothetical protein